MKNNMDMKRSIEDTSIAFIGAGNLATNLAKAFYRKGFRIKQIYSRTEESAKPLAEAVEAEYVTSLSDVAHHAQFYVVAVKDDALTPAFLSALVSEREKGLWVHTAGSIPVDIWRHTGAGHYGVFYPMQTFSKSRPLDFKEIPIFVEGNNDDTTARLEALGGALSGTVRRATSEEREHLHLAAVFACNFTNHMYALALDVLRKYNLPFNLLLPLIDETARKVHALSPRQAQTGPALRNDTGVMNAHLALLADDERMRQLYGLISKSIHREAGD